jgi:hypothetical protein
MSELITLLILALGLLYLARLASFLSVAGVLAVNPDRAVSGGRSCTTWRV